MGICCMMQGAQPGVCDNLEGWGGMEGGRGGSRGTGHMYSYGWFILRQKPVQHCKAIILRLKINFKTFK